ncbi:MAG: FAD-dependent oxidoreductase [Ferrimicrobium sp.]|uniref:FAD-dependent oxidoreductase n=1 Tax=Ferrimicrobium acidiphilum TaxID=121039 RepID=A0ABV3Y1Y1_9ACTN|nr:FAD-dependent oxidoreductase [Ferrimicrobium sp.]
MEKSPTVAIVGAGMAGLAAAHYLTINHIDFELYEATDRPGGRVASEQTDGLTLDRGFQVLLEDYPELRRLVAVADLPLHRLYPGAYIHRRGVGPLLLSDPRRVPATYRATLNAAKDLLGMPSLAAIWRYLTTPAPTIEDLVALFPEPASDNVLAPLFRGITLDPSLSQSARFARFVLRRLMNGYGSLPSEGMAQLPSTIAMSFGDQIHYHHRVTALATGRLDFQDLPSVHPDWIILAVDPPQLSPLLGLELPPMRSVGFIHALCSERLFGVPAVLLPPRQSPIYTVAPMSDIAPSYVSNDPERHLITASCDPSVAPDELRSALALALERPIETFEFVEIGVVDGALPRPTRVVREVGRHLLLAGDYLESPSLNGAIASGRKAAERIIQAVDALAGKERSVNVR